MSLGRRVALLLLTTVPPLPLCAQSGATRQGLCLLGHPGDRCSAFLLTNAGPYVRPPEEGHSPLRFMVDWGAMANVRRQDAVGVSWFVTWDEDGFSTGPELHYRRWLRRERAVELMVGTIASGGVGPGGSALLVGIKYQPQPEIGVVLRPERVRRPTVICTTTPCVSASRTTARVYGGFEFTGMPGATVSLASGLTLVGVVVFVLAAIAHGD